MNKLIISIGLMYIFFIIAFILLERLDVNNLYNNQAEQISVYFLNQSLIGESINSCSDVYPVKRTISKSNNNIETALTELFRGPTGEEVVQGYESCFSDKTKDILINVKIKNKTAYVNLKDIRQTIPDSCTFCGKPLFFAQVSKTVRQFGTVDKIIYAINGDTKTFYEWMRVPCNEENDFCSNEIFKNLNSR